VPRTARTAPASDAETGRAGDARVAFPEIDGRRSTTATCRAIVADAARAADPELSSTAERCENWRKGYAPLLRELTALAAEEPRALAIARAGIDSMRTRLVLEGDGGAAPLAGSLDRDASEPQLGTGEIAGTGAPATRLEVPYRGRTLHDGALVEQLERWVTAGAVEPSFAEAVELVSENPGWLSLPGRTVAVIGAGSEIGPLGPLCAWGADVLAVDLPDERVWARVRETAQRGSGTVRMPLAADGTPGLDVVADPAATRAWLARELGESTPVLGMYGYADGGAHVLLSGAFDAIAAGISSRRADAAIAFLATPTDSYVVPARAVARARAAYRARRLRRVAQAPLKLASGGRLYRPAYENGAGEASVADALIEQQGPNYAIAKRLQRWQGLLAAADGRQVSFNVAPATLTRSVTKNKVLAAAYAGARHFGIEIFEPATTRTLMAALLVHDLHRRAAEQPQGEGLFSDGAAHGGLWTAAYEPRSALGLAAVAGLPSILFSRHGAASGPGAPESATREERA